jgi:Raf kinase inhibitor-like YbhB/YbcL family protein
MADLIIKSPVFQPNRPIHKKYSCDDEDINPPLTVEAIPPQTKTIALVIEDPDAVSGTFDHWIVYNIAPTGKIEENSNQGTVGLNSANETAYTGMCPPSGTHRYAFKVYALDIVLDLKPRVTGKKELERAMVGHVLAKGELIGLYRR